ncbi:hypothetical protein MGG_15939 [Pyricularia oryzae 70-15]|uniref:Uncharacterized protein n=3 Tax=Pyricularia oryzae TaxID=318829 RepID=G4MWR6_PYRO7|nr:uncharacterized protein MGG_15939 [Pyricularia oryzae 70-15]EHA55920.1 hypothetical protein MGG_15939 [Pyricularia oryzae 70-15]ELQ43505.1 hypothetical protein OOU_Y34scaffold00148g8 [Pyricularia oryzae Y34]
MVASRIAEITICCAVEYCVPRKTGREGAMADRLRPIGQYEWHLHVPSAGLVWKRPRAGGGGKMIRSEWGRELASENDQETERGPDEQLNSTQFGICANLRLCGTGVWFDVYVVVQATPR